MKMQKRILSSLLCLILSLTSFSAFANTAWNGEMWEANGNTTLPPVTQDDILWLPAASVLSQCGIECVENEGVLTSGTITMAAGSALVNNNGNIQIATLSPKIINGAIYAPQKLIERLFPLSVRVGKDGGVKVTFISNEAEDDSWFYAMGLSEPTEPDKSGLSPAEVVMENVRISYYKPTSKPAQPWYELLPDGSFPDLDYKSQEKQSWDPGTHVQRLADLTAILYTPTNPLYHNPEWMEKLRIATEFWVAGNFVSSNWWWNEKGVITRFQNMCVFDISDLGLKDETYEIVMKRSVAYGDAQPQWFDWHAKEKGMSTSAMRPYYGTGSGVPSRIASTLKGLGTDISRTQEEKDILVRECLDGLSYELSLELYAPHYNPTGRKTFSYSQSIKADKSYHEHGNQNLPTTYGATMLRDLYAALSYTNGCGELLTEEGAIGLRDVLLDGFRYFWKNNYPTWTTGGRQFSISTSEYSTNLIRANLFFCNYLLENYPQLDRRDELLDYKRMVSLAAQDKHFDGTRFFWQSDLLSHHRAEQNFLFSVQGISNRIETPEKTSNAGLKNRYLANGCYEILKTGNEFWGIAPALNWRKIPGTTVAQDEEMSLNVPASRMGTTSFCGGLSDGQYGFSTYDMNEDEVVAKKSWFCFDNEIVCLGAGISSSNENEVFTTFNQYRLDGDVLTDKGKVTEAFTSLSNCKWILHGGIGYVPFLENSDHNIEIEVGPKTGSWHEINAERAEDDIETHDLFLAGLNHSNQPEGDTYHYAILPDTDEKRIQEYVENVPYKVVENTASQQAVYYKDLGLFMAVFHEAGTVTTPDGQSIRVDVPCVIMLRTYKDGSYQVTAANPNSRELIINAELSGKVSKKIIFELGAGEKGNEAGMPVTFDSKTNEFLKNHNVMRAEDGESSEIAEVWAITVDGELVEDSFYTGVHYKTITIDALPEIKAKGNYPAHIDIDDSRAIISIIDPNNPYNRADYRILFTWKTEDE